MKLSKKIFIILFFIGNATLGTAQNVPLDQSQTDVYATNFSYFIGPGDELDIKVWRHPDLDTQVIVRPDCQISFPLIENNIQTCDLTTTEFQQVLTTGLSNTIKDPRITVNVAGFHSNKVFVLGEVIHPGLYSFEGRLSVLDAISRAGGYDKTTAVLKSILVVRRGHDRESGVIKVNLWDVIQNANFKENIILEPGDIVFVPKSFIAKVDDFIDQFFTKTEPVLRYYLDIVDIDQRTPPGRNR